MSGSHAPPAKLSGPWRWASVHKLYGCEPPNYKVLVHKADNGVCICACMC